MTTQINFKKGDVLFRQGDASDSVLRIIAGEIEVLRDVGAASALLGYVRDGEWLGEMSVIENRSHSATARAATDGSAEALSPQQFLELVSGDPALARALILRLSIRLRTIDDKIADDLLPVAFDHLSETDHATSSAMARPVNHTITLSARTDALRAYIGAAPITIERLPYVVGRVPDQDESEPPRHPNLQIHDVEPFHLSRDHLMISRKGGRLFVTDLGSTLGTIVNGLAIGHHFMRDTAPLRRGENRVLAGGWHSPFDFTVRVE